MLSKHLVAKQNTQLCTKAREFVCVKVTNVLENQTQDYLAPPPLLKQLKSKNWSDLVSFFQKSGKTRQLICGFFFHLKKLSPSQSRKSPYNEEEIRNYFASTMFQENTSVRTANKLNFYTQTKICKRKTFIAE